MKRAVMSLLVMLMLLACGGEDSQQAGEPYHPELPVDTLSTILDIGVEMGDSTDTFSAIVSALIDDEGNILVLDQVEATVKLYAPDGDYVRHLTRRGNGPGELGMPWQMFTFPDGRLVVLDLMKQGFVVFDDSLEFMEELSLWVQNPPFLGSSVSDSQFVAYKIEQDIADNEITIKRVVALYTYGEDEWDSILWQDSIVATMSEIMADPSIFITSTLDPLSLCTDDSGDVFFALKDGEDYTITKWNTLGDEMFQIGMDLSPVEKSPEEVAAESIYVNSYIERMSGGAGAGFRFSPDPFKDMVIDLDIGPDGCLWARRGTMDQPFFDIYDPDTGELLHHAVFPVEGWSWRTNVCDNGILAWEEDPELGYQVLYILQVSEDKQEDIEEQL